MATRRFWQSTVPMMLPDSSKNGQTWPMTSLFINRTRLIKSGGALENWVPWWAPSRYMKSWLIKILLWRRRTFQMTLSTNQFWSRRAGGSLQSAMTLIPDPSLMTLLILMTEYIWIHLNTSYHNIIWKPWHIIIIIIEGYKTGSGNIFGRHVLGMKKCNSVTWWWNRAFSNIPGHWGPIYG